MVPHHIKNVRKYIEYGMTLNIFPINQCLQAIFDLPSHNQTCRAGKSTLIGIALVITAAIRLLIIAIWVNRCTYAHIYIYIFTYMLATYYK